MTREISEKTLKRIGLVFFILVVLLSLSILFIVQEFILIRYYPLKVRFNFIADVKKGSEVKFTGGYRVGYVKSITRAGSQVEVELAIREDFRVREKAEISLFTSGMMGEKFIELEQNEYSGGYLEPGSLLRGNDAFSLEIFQMNMARLTDGVMGSTNRDFPTFTVLLGNVNRSLRAYNNILRGIRGGTAEDIMRFRMGSAVVLARVAGARDFIAQVRSGIKSLGKEEIRQLFLGIKDLNEDLEGINRSLENMIRISGNLKYETAAVIRKENRTGQLIFDRNEYKNLEKKIKELEDFSKRIARNPSALLAK